jgi:hypothetical protein
MADATLTRLRWDQAPSDDDRTRLVAARRQIRAPRTNARPFTLCSATPTCAGRIAAVGADGLDLVNRRRHTARKPMGYRAPDISLVNDCWTYVMAC